MMMDDWDLRIDQEEQRAEEVCRLGMMFVATARSHLVSERNVDTAMAVEALGLAQKILNRSMTALPSPFLNSPHKGPEHV